MGTRVLAAIPLSDDDRRRLSAYDLVCLAASEPGFAGALAEAEALLTSNRLPIGDDLLERAPRLRVVSLFGVGYENVDLRATARRGILVANTPGVLTDAVADFTLALILTVARRLPDAAAAVSAGRWSGGVPLGFDLRDRTLGIVGFGRIGREVADRAAGFKMRIVYHDAFDVPPHPRANRAAGLEELLGESDIVSLHVDLNPSSRHLLGAEQLNLMRPGSVLVNTSRGPVIDEAALVESLRAGRPAVAALDVLEQEPPSPDNPLLSMPQVVVMPHVASATVETRRAMLDLALENLCACVDGRPCACILPVPS